MEWNTKLKKSALLISFSTLILLGCGYNTHKASAKIIHKLPATEAVSFKNTEPEFNSRQTSVTPKTKVSRPLIRATTYIVPNQNQQIQYIPNYNLKNFKNNTALNNNEELRAIKAKRPIKTQVIKQTSIGNNTLYLVKLPKRNYKGWVLGQEISNSRKTTYHSSAYDRMLKNIYSNYMNRYFTPSQRQLINNNQRKIKYLNRYRNKAKDDSSLSNFRKEEVQWINFYRQGIFHERPVYEAKEYDNIAQRASVKNRDPEDMDRGSYTPLDSVTDYITDANDVDNDGTTGHRNSILRPSNQFTGIGQYGGRNALFFDWGVSGYKTNQKVSYPTAGIFPLADAQQGEYWSYPLPRHAKFQRLSLRDKTLNDKLMQTRNIHVKKHILYYKVNPNQMHDHHQYKITVYMKGHKDIYNTRLYTLDPKL